MIEKDHRPTRSLNLFLAEDGALLRDGLSAILERAGHRVSAVADAPSLITEVDAAIERGTQPDIVITDVRMPPLNATDGLDAAIELRRRHPGLPILVLSQYIARGYLPDLLADGDGGIGYLLKERVGRVADFLASLDVVRSGGTVIDPTVVREMLPTTSSPLDVLTPRELEVLAHMAEGTANAKIAQTLFVSEAAVSKHIGSIFAKLGLTETESGHRRVMAVLMYLGTLDNV